MASAWLPPVPPWSPTDKSSFAYQSVAKRWPTIITSAIDALYQASYALSYSSDVKGSEEKCKEAKEIIEKLSKLKHDMGRDKALQVIEQDGGDSTDEYNSVVEANGWTWFTAPWLFAECYLYRLLRSFFAQSIYWQHYDPFSTQKVSAFRSSATAINQLSEAVEELIKKAEDRKDSTNHLEESKIVFRELVQTSLWGNATDLSLLTHLTHGDIQALQAGGVGAKAQAKRQHYILSGLTGIEGAWDCLVAGKGGSGSTSNDSQVDIILDNSGFELFTDLLLADFLLAAGLASKICFHPKDMPWFVSDVTPSDFLFTIEALQYSTDFFEKMNHADKINEEGAKDTSSSQAADAKSDQKSNLDPSYFVDSQSRSVSPSRSFVIDTRTVVDINSSSNNDNDDQSMTKQPDSTPSSSKQNATQRLASRWAQHLKAGTFELSMPLDTTLGGNTDLQKTSQASFWTSYHNYPSLPLAAPRLFEQLQKSTLIISKGDLNYRKWCSDARWSFSEPFANVLGPVENKLNLLVLRTNKADVCVGVPKERLAGMDEEDANWRTNGKYAMVEFVPQTAASK